MIDFIDDQRGVYGVEPIGKILPIAPSTYYQVKGQASEPSHRSAHQKRDAEMRDAIQQIWQANKCVYRAQKVGTRDSAIDGKWPVARSSA